MTHKQRVIALGFFDGVHLGHGELLRTAVAKAHELGSTATAFTFDCHPASAITGDIIPLLSTVSDREQLMRQYFGVEEVIVSHFGDMVKMDWEDFITDYLIDTLHVCHVVAGHDFHFGYLGKGNPQRLEEKCRTLGIGCTIIPKIEEDGITISSTYIRTLIAQGEMDRAVAFLGHPHTLTGHVEHGKKLGSRVLGFPTVNLRIPDSIIVPALGVYATRIHVDGLPYLAVTNVGCRPTVEDGDTRITVEGFLLDFTGDLYGKEVRIEFYTRLREERHFPNLQALSAEIARNEQQTRDFFAQFCPK